MKATRLWRSEYSKGRVGTQFFYIQSMVRPAFFFSRLGSHKVESDDRIMLLDTQKIEDGVGLGLSGVGQSSLP